jgi:hypothetical protein
MDEERGLPAERSGADERRRPPGDFTTEQLQEDTARFLDELRRRTEKKQRQLPRKKRGPPPAKAS